MDERIAILAECDARWRGARGSVLLATASVFVFVLSVFAAEAAVRLCAPDSLVRSRGFLVASDVYGWALRKGVSVSIEGERYSINRHGYRGRDVAQERAGGRSRVVLLGDSIGFGLGVSDEETFARILDTRNNDIELVNLAVQGYGPDQELLVLEREGLGYEPDVVVVAFCLANDFADVMLPVSLYNGRTPKPRFRLVGEELVADDTSLRQPYAQRMQQKLADESYLLNLLSVATPPRAEPSDGGWHQRYSEALRDEDRVLDLTLAILHRMKRSCEERGIAFVLVVFPDAGSYKAKPRLVERFFASLATEGVSVLDMSSAFRDVGLRRRHVALDGTGHLTSVGHAVTAEVLQARIRPVALARDTPSSEGWPPIHLLQLHDRMRPR
jgi:hypothetical protein